MALFVCALIAAGCGGDDDETTTTTSAGTAAKQKVDAAVTSCSDEAQQLGGTEGTAPCEQDLSHEPPDTPLPDAVVQGAEPYLVVGAMAGG